MKISEKSNGRIIEKWLKFPSSHSEQRNRLLYFAPAFFLRFNDLEPMLSGVPNKREGLRITGNGNGSI